MGSFRITVEIADPRGQHFEAAQMRWIPGPHSPGPHPLRAKMGSAAEFCGASGNNDASQLHGLSAALTDSEIFRCNHPFRPQRLSTPVKRREACIPITQRKRSADATPLALWAEASISETSATARWQNPVDNVVGLR